MISEKKNGNRKKNRKRKSGKLNPDLVLLGLHVIPETKALVSLVAERCGETMTETLLRGFSRIAEEVGVTSGNIPVGGASSEISVRAAKIRRNKAHRQAMEKNASSRNGNARGGRAI